MGMNSTKRCITLVSIITGETMKAKAQIASVLYATLSIFMFMVSSNVIALDPSTYLRTMVLQSANNAKMHGMHNGIAFEAHDSLANPASDNNDADLMADHISNNDDGTIIQSFGGRLSNFHKSPMLTVTFENDVIDLLKLSNKFAENPDLPKQLIEHLRFTINGHEILPYEKK